MGWKIRGSNPSGGDIFSTRSNRPQGPPSLLYSGYRVSFPGLRRPGHDVNHSRPCGAEFKERVGQYLYFCLGLHGRLYGDLCLLRVLNEARSCSLPSIYVNSAMLPTDRTLTLKSAQGRITLLPWPSLHCSCKESMYGIHACSIWYSRTAGSFPVVSVRTSTKR